MKLSIEQLLYDPCEGLEADPTASTHIHVQECYQILAGPVINLPIQIQWNNERMVKSKEIIARANERKTKINKKISEAKKKIAEANARIDEAKAYLYAAIERCKATYGEADTAIALEILLEKYGVPSINQRASEDLYHSTILLSSNPSLIISR